MLGQWRAHELTCALRRAREAHRQDNREARALAELALHRDPAAEQLGELARQRQAQSRAAQPLLQAHVELHEIREQVRHVFGGDADAGVGHRELDLVIVEHARGDAHLALRA